MGSIITKFWHYNSWGDPISPHAQRIEQPFLWNGAYGYEYIPFTGLYHVGAREYDPRTARWLQRDPIGVAGGHPNVYLYCGNDPLNSADPYGLDWNWAKYFRDVGNVFVGYGQAIWGVISSPYTIGKFYWEHGVSWELTKQLLGGMWSGFCGDWQAAWAGDAQAFGRAFGGVLITVGTAAAPFAKGGTAAGSGSGILRQATSRTTLGQVRASTALAPRYTLSQHAKMRLAERGITPTMVDKAIERGKLYWDPENKTVVYVLENATIRGKHLIVAVNPHTNVVTTALFTRRVPNRFQPLNCGR